MDTTTKYALFKAPNDFGWKSDAIQWSLYIFSQLVCDTTQFDLSTRVNEEVKMYKHIHACRHEEGLRIRSGRFCSFYGLGNFFSSTHFVSTELKGLSWECVTWKCIASVTSRRLLIKLCWTSGKSRLLSKAVALEIEKKETFKAFRPFHRPKRKSGGGRLPRTPSIGRPLWTTWTVQL